MNVFYTYCDICFLLLSLVYASSQEDYIHNRDQFFDSLRSTGNQKNTNFIEYFMNNWDDCRDRWVSYLRHDCVHLGNNTNNRLENARGKIKLDVDRYTEFDACLQSLLVWQMIKETSFAMDVQTPTSQYNYNFPEELQQLGSFITSFALDLIAEQYECAMNVSYSECDQCELTMVICRNQQNIH